MSAHLHGQADRSPHGQAVGPLVPGWTPRPMPRRATLTGHWVHAVPLAAEHADDLAELCLDDDLWTYRPAVRPTDAAQMRELFIEPALARTDAVVFAFVPTTGPVGGRAAGVAALAPCVPGNGVAEISGVLWSHPLQRTAASTEAVHLLLAHLFDDLGYRRAEW